jgi:hypothetical protein
MTRSRILLTTLVLSVAVALALLGRASFSSDGWTWNEASAHTPDGWTWDEARFDADGWTWDEAGSTPL